MIYGTGAVRRDRMLIAAVWLISLGSLFIVQDVGGWAWTQAWPLWIVFVGVGTMGTAIVNRHYSRLGIWAVWWPLAVIAVGLILLVATTGVAGTNLAEVARWWPVLAIGVGVWFLVGAALYRQPSHVLETMAIPLDGVRQADVRMRFGGGELVVGQAPPNTLISGQFEGGVFNRSPEPGRIELEPGVDPLPFGLDRPLHWNVGLTSQIPVDLRLETGASRSFINLNGLLVRRVTLKTGASETRVRLPVEGITTFSADAGMASLNIEVPQGVAARIKSRMAIGTTSVDEHRFPRFFDGWSSPDFETATNRVDIEVKGGLGAVRVS